MGEERNDKRPVAVVPEDEQAEDRSGEKSGEQGQPSVGRWGERGAMGEAVEGGYGRSDLSKGPGGRNEGADEEAEPGKDEGETLGT